MSTPASALLSGLRTQQATSPALIWYGSGGERIELSGKVLDNWVAKTANFLVDELDAEPGLRLRLDLPVHWKTLVWVLAGWQTGCTVVWDPEGSSAAADVTVTASAQSTGPGTVVAVALGALDLAYPADLAPGVVDYAAEVRSYADTYLEGPAPDASVSALEVHGGTSAALLQGTVPYSALPAGGEPAGTPGVLLAASADLPLVLEAALQTWASGGALVLTGEGVDPGEKVLASERVTKRLEA
ncbi:TIGR03089 family protein [Arthrobacter sp. zg-Y1143]|uniref:TIGR03089 family protein n=1 Tax=Arthrobacter sp. zg-Y1143 TaxID=3049065 RepID=UPI0024C2D11B|nr:TIGR03089 family protein [Arthrobacter sp. zg-Y1143]MDK1328512.1 TIGR03089 family protein [Arthrobacter sp. zg-Y1143]